MQFGILGPLEALRDGVAVELGGVQRRALMARLLLDPGRTVAADRLIDDLWGDKPPATARKTLQKYVSELRRILPEPVLKTSTAGYVLDVAAHDVDATRFEKLVASGEYTEALSVWRGEVLVDLPEFGFVTSERARLDELRLSALQGSLEEELGRGRHDRAVAQLAELVETYPQRERLVALYMLALYRSGRQGDALGVFERHRRRMDDELGVAPGAELRELQVAILRQEPGLGSPVKSDPAPSERAPGNLPQSLNAFIGRDAELHTLEDRLTGNRLVTITGPGGIGKTRLALHAAQHSRPLFADGAWLVDLAELTGAEQLPSAVALALHIDTRHATNAADAVAASLAHGGPRLILFDNCEHLLAACTDLVLRILHSSPHLTLLATSRHPLGVDGEYVLQLASLPNEQAVQLFLDRSQSTGPPTAENAPQQIAQLCTQCDGLPLAIELAASQLRVLTMTELLERIGDQLAFRRAGPRSSPRQATLRDMVGCSYELIPDTSKQVFARLSVFRGSLTLAGAEAVCADLELQAADLLAEVTTLVDHCLVLRTGEPSSQSRFRLLESLRLFASERLADFAAVDTTRRAHAAYLLSFARDAARNIYGPDEQAWQRQFEAEAANLEAALAWAVDHDRALALDLTATLWPYWEAGWGERTAIGYLDQLLSRSGGAEGRPQPVSALVVAADMAANRGDARKAVPWARNAVQAVAVDGDLEERARALTALGSALGAQGALDEATEIMADAVATAAQLGDDVLTARALDRSHFVAARRGDHARAEHLAREELTVWRTVGSRRGQAGALRHLAVTAYRLGDLDRSEALCGQALAMWRDIDDPAAIAHVETTLADIARQRGDTAGATALYQTALENLKAIGDRRCEASTYKNLALCAADDAPGHSIRLLRDAIAVPQELGDEAGLAECIEGLADTLRRMSRHAESVILLSAAAGIRRRTETRASSTEKIMLDSLEAAEKAQLGQHQYQQYWHRGERMGVDEIIDFVRQIAATDLD